MVGSICLIKKEQLGGFTARLRLLTYWKSAERKKLLQFLFRFKIKKKKRPDVCTHHVLVSKDEYRKSSVKKLTPIFYFEQRH